MDSVERSKEKKETPGAEGREAGKMIDMGQAQRTCDECGALIPQQHLEGECSE